MENYANPRQQVYKHGLDEGGSYLFAVFDDTK